MICFILNPYPKTRLNRYIPNPIAAAKAINIKKKGVAKTAAKANAENRTTLTCAR